MNGRLESKIKIEKRTLESIKDSGYNLTSFFNSLAAKYEASSKETYITYIINFLKAMNKPVSEITSDEINNYFIDLTYKTNKKGEIIETSGMPTRAFLSWWLRSYMMWGTALTHTLLSVSLRPTTSATRRKSSLAQKRR